MKRVLVIGPTPPPIGGDTVSTRALLESAWWADFGLEPVHLNTSRGGGIRGVNEPLGPADLVRGAGLMVRIAAMIPRVKVVCLWTNSRFFCTIGLAIVAVARLARRPVVVKPFGAFFTDFLRGLPGIHRRLALGGLSRAAFVFPQTRSMADELVREFGLCSGKVVCLPNFIIGEIDPRGADDRRFTGRCVFLGQIKREKGIFEIVEALRSAPRFTCDLYGPVLERDRREFFESLAGAPNIRYNGVVDPERVRSVVGGYELLLLPSYHVGEGYPGVILEAFASGVPVVASRWKSIPELVADGERGILVPVRAPGEILAALERLERDPELYRSMCRAVGRYVAAFSERAVVRDILLARVRDLACGKGKRQ